MPRTAAETNRGLTTIFKTMANRKEQYKEGVSKNHHICVSLADRLTTGGGIKDDLLQFNKGSAHDDDGDDKEQLIPEEEFLQFFEKQSIRLKAIAENNAKRDRKVDAFAGAILKLQEKIANDDNNNDDEDQENEYETMIQDSMKEEMERLNAEGDIKQTAMYKEICNLLGDKDASDKQGDDDDEIEVMRNDDENRNKCKCPLMATWMEDPLKNKACGHTYSRQGIMAHIQAKGGKAMCPWPGCDKAVLQKDLEPDPVIARMVKRFKRQAAAEEEQRKMTQCLDDTMEEED